MLQIKNHRIGGFLFGYLPSVALAKSESEYCRIIQKGIGQIHTGSEKPGIYGLNDV
jgi:hypothetical protein